MEDQQIDIVGTPQIDLAYYIHNVSHFFSSHGGDFWIFSKGFVGIFVGLSIPVALFFLIAIVITVENLKRVHEVEEEKFMTPPKQEPKHEKVDQELAKRWRTVVEHANSQNPNDWKQAIIEADVMLEQLVTKLGYRGESLGEQLKRTTKGDFKSRDQAWEAHLVRNRIAHDGSEFELNDFEAKRVIGLYRQVFDEFYHISEL